MRLKIDHILQNQGYNFFSLPLIARLLLVTDGTVTELIEALVCEPIVLGFRQQTLRYAECHTKLDAEKCNCLYRRITLKGTCSQVDWVYAESVILHEKLNAQAQTMLLEETTPIGVILREQFPDNHRVITHCGFVMNPNAAQYLKLEPQYQFLYRSYQVVENKTAIMNISEWFPLEQIEAVIHS